MKKILLASLLAFIAIPSAFAANQNFNVSWTTVSSIDKYELVTRVNAGTPVTQTVVQPATSGTVTAAINAGDTFFAKVRACNAQLCGDYSPEVSFVMLNKPAAPAILGIQLIITP